MIYEVESFILSKSFQIVSYSSVIPFLRNAQTVSTMKFCFVLFAVLFCISSVEGAVLSIPGQLQILNVVYKIAFNSSLKPVMSIKDCFCKTTKRPCYDILNNMSNSDSFRELKSVLSYIQPQNSSCQSGTTYFLGVPNKLKPTTYTNYSSSDFNPPRLNSTFLANAICGTYPKGLKVASCVQPVNISATGLTSAQMFTLMDAFSSIVQQNPQNVCPNYYTDNYIYKDQVSKELSRYPQSLQYQFNFTITAACMKNGMSDITSMTDFYLNVFCAQVNCTYPMLLQ